jgi:hypothetical protein
MSRLGTLNAGRNAAAVKRGVPAAALERAGVLLIKASTAEVYVSIAPGAETASYKLVLDNGAWVFP